MKTGIKEQMLLDILNDKNNKMIIDDYQDILMGEEESLKKELLLMIKEFPFFQRTLAIQNEDDGFYAGCVLMESRNIFSVKIVQSGFIFETDSEAIQWAKSFLKSI